VKEEIMIKIYTGELSNHPNKLPDYAIVSGEFIVQTLKKKISLDFLIDIKCQK